MRDTVLVRAIGPRRAGLPAEYAPRHGLDSLAPSRALSIKDGEARFTFGHGEEHAASPPETINLPKAKIGRISLPGVPL